MRVDPDVLRRELGAWRWPHDDPEARDEWVRAAIPRIAATLELLPEADASAALLELGAPPFFTALCLRRLWPGRLVHSGFPYAGARRITERLSAVDGSAEQVFELDCFNVETDPFPYPDASFDVVIFSELIEHLAVNPVWTLAEIHRVLRPGGHVIVTTPNALSLERLRTWLGGRSEPVDRYMPLFGYGARHNREWHVRDLRAIFDATGWTIETLVARDLDPPTPFRRLRRGAVRLLLRPFTRLPHHAHLFVRARRGDVFRWRFPELLFDHMALYRCVRHPFVEMDVNDAIQCGGGWGALERVDGAAVRRIVGDACAWLRGEPSARRLVVRARGVEAPARLGVALTRGDDVLARGTVDVPAGTWTDAAVELTAAAGAGDELELRLDPRAPIAITRIALE